ncbi:hypothetical protein GCM10022222_66960 [Amycolatopsis ultiminotia]|uniref:Uncharacterized protein n=1 Tax=Amycolatopsis ultiminotia TaxID=543629 RepID=A0ABP6XXI4_9PSEU
MRKTLLLVAAAALAAVAAPAVATAVPGIVKWGAAHQTKAVRADWAWVFRAVMNKLGLPQSVLDSYDVIGFDPRGVGHSTPVTCNLTPEQQAKGKIPRYARDGMDVVKRAEEIKTVASQRATSRSAWMLPYVTTADTVRDMDRIRVALGESTISYDGYS